jgi:tripartite-type tricarboxylate transporter receptor subunit TctC
MRRCVFLALAATLPLICTPAFAGNGPNGYPDHSIRLVVPFPAAGATDLMARSLAQKLSQDIGSAIVVDNRAGAGGAIGAEAVATAPKDGYTLLYSTMGVLVINPSLYPHLSYDPIKSFAPIAMTHVTANLLVVNPTVPAHSVPELIALANKHPGELTFSSSGNGTSSHLSGELFKSMAHVKIQHVPYKGTSGGINDLLAGRITMTFDTISNFVEYVKSGRARALAVTSRTRSPALPDVPSMSEIPGFKDFEVSLWSGVLAPAGTPSNIVGYLNQRIAKVMTEPAMKTYLAPYSIEPLHSTPQAFSAQIATDEKKWETIVKGSGAVVN